MVQLSEDQYKALIEVIENAIDIKLDEKLDEKLQFLPTKEEFFDRMDKLSNEIKDLRDEVAVTNGQNVRNTKRLDRVEDHLDLPSLDL